MATQWADLVPTSVARDLIAAAEAESAVLRLGNTIVMPSGVVSVPVGSVAPTATFVATGARKPASAIEWTAERLVPEEIALTTYVPDAYLDDAGFPVWDSVRIRLRRPSGLTCHLCPRRAYLGAYLAGTNTSFCRRVRILAGPIATERDDPVGSLELASPAGTLSWMRIARPVAAAVLAAAFVVLLWYGISARWGEPFTAVGAWGVLPS